MPPKKSALQEFQEGLAKKYGGRVAVSNPGHDRYETISTGALVLDHALYYGGWKRGGVHEIVGPPDAAKTTLMINTAVQAQLAFPKLLVGYVDMEGTFDDYWAELNGLDLSAGRWEHLYADHGEQASDMMKSLVQSGVCSLVILDSVGGMESKKALDKDAADPLPGANAQVITRMVKNLANAARATRATVILVNQLRASIGQAGGDVSAGPKAMQHSTTTKVQLARIGAENSVAKLVVEAGEDPEIVAQQFRARVTRSKIFPPGRRAEFWVNNRPTAEYGPAGINVVDQWATMALRAGYAVKQGEGSWYVFPDGKRVNGRKAVGARIRGDEAERARLRAFLFDIARAQATARDIEEGKPE